MNLPDYDAVRELAPKMAELVVDNPWQMALLLSGDYVIGRAVVNIVKPRGVLGILACAIVAGAITGAGSAALVGSGLLPMRMRDKDGRLVPIFPAGALE